MFIDEKKPASDNQLNQAIGFDLNSPKIKLAVLIATSLSAIVLLIIGFLLLKKPEPVPVVNRPGAPVNLPSDETGGSLSGGQTVAQQPTKGETVFFSDFYEPISSLTVFKNHPVTLPINIKKDAANYYPFARQINVDQAIDGINANGFAVIDNPFAKESKDFLSIYQELNKRNVPFLVTADFMIYAWQNRIKTIYKQAEVDIFYREFWELNQAMFKMADKRYRDRYTAVGVLNDPLLEALRLEAVYFAVNLELLKPKAGQIIKESKESVTSISGPGYFSGVEAEKYRFDVPDYLDPSISQEMELITKGKANWQLKKSPALLYQRDYSEFEVPEEYRRNAHLNNFYLASRWTTSLFPLFFKDDSCETCLLDKEDWTINLTAAALISRDLSLNQDWKNRWAKIYKAMSYFNGLRSELTYLDYHNSFIDLFGDKAVEEVFDKNNQQLENDLLKYRDAVAANDFDPAKGGLNRQLESGKRMSGMRILQDAFDPETFIYDQLTFDGVGKFINYDQTKTYPGLVTGCSLKMLTLNRCTAIGLDLINPVFDEPITSQYFSINSNYENYANQMPKLRKHFADFDNAAWHDNFFWTTLDINRKMLNGRKQSSLPYTLGSAWTNQLLNTAVSTNLNAKLPLDVWNQAFTADESLSTLDTVVKYHYVEPNLPLVNELSANTKMIFKTFIALGLVKENDDAFVELDNDFESLRSLVIKQLENQELLLTDWVFLNNFVGKSYVDKLNSKERFVKFYQPGSDRFWRIFQSVEKVKLLISAQYQQGRIVLVAGPVFSFTELRR